MSDGLDFDMEVVEEDELDELGADSASSSEDRSRSESREEAAASKRLEGEERSLDTATTPDSDRRSSRDSGDRFQGKERKEKVGASSTGGSLYSLPEDWSVRSLGSDFDIEYGDEKQPQELEEGYPLYGANGIIGRSDEYLFEDPIVTVTCRGATCGNVHLTEPKSWVTNNSLVLQKRSEVNNYFVADALRYHSVERAITGSAQQQITSGMLGKMDYPVPPLPEQRKIASVLYTVDQAIQKTEAIIDQAKRVKRGLMQHLFHGRHKSYYEYKSTPVGEMPSHWNVESIGSVVEMAQYGISESMSEEGDYPIFRMNNIENGYMIGEPMKYIDLDDHEFEKYRVKEKDILFNRTNSLELVGKTGIYELEGDYVFASYLVRLRANDRVDPYYLNYYMNSYEGQNRMMDFATKGVSQANINANSIQQVKLPVPPKNEQKEIVSQLRAIDQEIEQNKVYVSQLRPLKTGLMQDLLSGEVRTADKAIEVLDEVASHG